MWALHSYPDLHLHAQSLRARHAPNRSASFTAIIGTRHLRGASRTRETQTTRTTTVAMRNGTCVVTTIQAFQRTWSAHLDFNRRSRLDGAVVTLRTIFVNIIVDGSVSQGYSLCPHHGTRRHSTLQAY